MTEDKNAIAKERMIQMIASARAGNVKPLNTFVDAARQGGVLKYREIFEAFLELVPDLEMREYDAFLED
jgi:hypothetical protein